MSTGSSMSKGSTEGVSCSSADTEAIILDEEWHFRLLLEVRVATVQEFREELYLEEHDCTGYAPDALQVYVALGVNGWSEFWSNIYDTLDQGFWEHVWNAAGGPSIKSKLQWNHCILHLETQLRLAFGAGCTDTSQIKPGRYNFVGVPFSSSLFGQGRNLLAEQLQVEADRLMAGGKEAEVFVYAGRTYPRFAEWFVNENPGTELPWVEVCLEPVSLEDAMKDELVDVEWAKDCGLPLETPGVLLAFAVQVRGRAMYGSGSHWGVDAWDAWEGAGQHWPPGLPGIDEDMKHIRAVREPCAFVVTPALVGHVQEGRSVGS